ncbi:MAG TPA: molybdopterin cofactor-binding domain-containing protein [Candidatus Acidoferrales bacterium]|jgi:CO/xanthine dehydrogenase Mo-binding subunit|nr:molybdopterin cofactor-binding domain-containing protein [Candidatus Acidoferrales bacterium]
METKSISRRDLLKGTGVLIVGFSFFGTAARVLAQGEGLSVDGMDPTVLDSWMAISKDGTVTVFTGKVELGTGVVTALAQIVAEELDVSFNKVYMDSGDTDKAVDQGVTAAARTVERGGVQLRQASAAARQELLKLASAHLDSPVDSLTVTDGVVSVVGNPSKKIAYGDLLGGKRFNIKIVAAGVGWDMKVAPEVPAKNPKDYKIVGKSIPRVDLPEKFTGEFVYSQDASVPGMLHGRVVRPATSLSAPASIDESSIKNIPGVVKIVREGTFVGIVAETEWAAIQAAQALKVTWSEPTLKMMSGPSEVFDYLKNTKSFKDNVVTNRGDLDAALSQAQKKYEATYYFPFQLHGMMGPPCALADVQGDKATIWTGTQGPFRTRDSIARMLNIPPKNVHLLYREGSGSYGRLESDDVAEDAALMSRAVAKPVRVQWMRADEHAWDPKGPAQLTTIRAGVDAQGKVIAWDFMDRSLPWSESDANPLLASSQIGIKPTGAGFLNGAGGGGQIYTFENQKVLAADIPWVQQGQWPLRTSNLRAPGDLARVFASESTIDEIAADQHVDPVQFRLRYLTSDKRISEILVATAKQAGWTDRPAPALASNGDKAVGRGVAVANRANTMTAAVAEIEVDRKTGDVTVKKITLGHDCGLIVNPDGLKNQIEGNVLQAVSRALLEEVKFDSAGQKNLDWDSYPVIRFQQIPDVEIVLTNRPEMQPLGGGEPSIVPVTAAIANAIFDATGARMRQVPFTPERVLSALKA